MKYIELDLSHSDVKWNMSFLHSHAYYEVYFLISGTRQLFLKDKIYSLRAPCVAVIPPYIMHKTEGEAFTRVNLCISPEELTEYEASVLSGLGCQVHSINEESFSAIRGLLDLAISIKGERHAYREERFRSVISYLILMLDSLPLGAGASATSSPSLILSVIDYINEHYKTGLSLAELSREFFLSKTALCAKFKAVMHCSINDYILKNKLNCARELLMSTDMSVEAVAKSSGFSSANYMGLVFKSKLGISPLQFKKQNEIREAGDRTSIRKRCTPKARGDKK